MRFLGQYIQNFISRFRNEVYLEDISNPGSDTDKFLVADSGGKVGFRTGTNLQSDLGVTPGTDVVDLVTIKSDLGDVARSSQTGQPSFTFQGGEGIDVTNSSDVFTVAGEDATDSNKGIVELATTSEATTGTDTARAVTAAGVAAVHATAQSGKNYRIINTSFRQDIGTTKYFIPFKSQDENVTVHREEVSELAVCDGRVVSVSLRVENLNTHSGDANVTFGVTTNEVGVSYSTFTEQETETLTINDGDDHHLFHYVFSNDKHWDSTDMFAISIQSDTDISGSSERFYITVVIEDDWSTYLGGSSREIDSTP